MNFKENIDFGIIFYLQKQQQQSKNLGLFINYPINT